MSDPDQIQARLDAALSETYAVTKLIGVGGMAMVFLALDMKHARQVAIKVLRPELSRSLGTERFLHEIQIVAQFQHPHILPLYDSGGADGLLYFVMPFVEGETLKDKMVRERQLKFQDALHIAGQVASALNYAHDRGVVHRDIKPENVLLSGGEAIVADFGVARAVSVASANRLTETGFAVGTPAYMSPEQASGDAIDGRADIYSLGCLVYETLAGQPPFTGPTVESVINQHVNTPAPSVAQIRREVPPPVAKAVARALAKTPADRFATAAEFGDSLQFAEAHVRLSTSHSGLTIPEATVQPTESRTKWLVGGAVTVLLAIVVALTLPRMGGNAGLTGPIRLTVLPFENIGAAADEYFADGITDEVTTRLAGVEGLSIVGRQSAAQYKASDKSAQQIGRELDVRYLLSATISWAKQGGTSRVRVRPRLVRTADAVSIWAGVYDEDLTEVFAVQAAIADSVAQQLGLALLDRSRAHRSTDNLEAYDFYLQAMDYYNRPVSRENYQAAESLYERALATDPNFAVAAARLSTVHSRMYWYSFDRSVARLEQARVAADSATALAPDLPETHIAHGEYHYRGYLEFQRALEEFERARAVRPNDSEILFDIALVERRLAFASQDRARILSSAEQIARLSELEPRNTTNAVQAAISYLVAREFDEADRQLARARAFAPDELRPHFWSAQLALSRSGDTAVARRHLDEATRLFPEELDAQAWWHVALLRTLRPPTGELVARLARVNTELLVRLSALAIQHRVDGNPDDATMYFDSLRITATELAARQPDEAMNQGFAGLAFAGLGRTAEAVASSELALQLSRIETDLLTAADMMVLAAASAMMIGRTDDAVSLLVDWVALPTWATVEWLRLDPLWDPLHSNARFQQLVAGN